MLFRSYSEDTWTDVYDQLILAKNEIDLLRKHIADEPNKHAIIREQLKKELQALMEYDPERRCWYLTDKALAMWDR